MEGRTVVRLIRHQRAEVETAAPSPYLTGYLAALDDLLELVEDRMWEDEEDMEEGR